MKRIKAAFPQKPTRSYTAGVQTAQEAASRLTRLEFDVARLQREIATSEQRQSQARSALEVHIGERSRLLKVISDSSPTPTRRLSHGA